MKRHVNCCYARDGIFWLQGSILCLLTHWGRVTHICVSKLTIIGSDNGLSPGRRQAIIWTNDGILLIWTIGTNFSEISSEIHAFSFKKMHLKMESAKWRPFCHGLNVLMHWILKLPVHQEACHWLCGTNNMYCCSIVNSIYLCQTKSKTWFKMWIHLS